MSKSISKEDITLESGVEIPTQRHNSIYPWDTMEVGESFELDKSKSGGARSSLNSLRKKEDEGFKKKKFISRTMGTDRIRFWRTE